VYNSVSSFGIGYRSSQFLIFGYGVHEKISDWIRIAKFLYPYTTGVDHRFSKCSVRSPRASRAIRLLIEILTWLILQLSKEAITARNNQIKHFQFTQEHQSVSNNVFFCFYF